MILFFVIQKETLWLHQKSQGLKPALKAARLSDIRFYDLRHSQVTILLKENVHPKIASARLGHSKIQVTMDTYSHLTDSIEGIAVDSLNHLLK
ncbi:tyrosine-type recombinase/integrase [Mesobacillus maritimus]|uniref:tyrosine-type recombinase/integrase n=1 Tax=Mesobacillus maritimus TaxID=1643336 RepID=UPI0038512A27